MTTGIIETYNFNRGYGFILITTGRKIFFHIRNWRSEETPTVGAAVIFEIGLGHRPGQEQAINVSLALAAKAGAE